MWKAASPLTNCGCQCSSLTFSDSAGVVQVIVVLCNSIVGNSEYFLFPHFVFCVSIACILSISYLRILYFFYFYRLYFEYFLFLRFLFCFSYLYLSRWLLYFVCIWSSSFFCICTLWLLIIWFSYSISWFRFYCKLLCVCMVLYVYMHILSKFIVSSIAKLQKPKTGSGIQM